MSDIAPTPTEMTPLQKQQHDINIRNFNSGLNQGRGIQQTLGKDSFLKILTEQLKNQDPLKPQDDKEFIAQMAQFNSLEQMMELNKGFTELSQRFGQNQALSLLGREVVINSGIDHEGNPILVSGLVSAIDKTTAGSTLLTVNGTQYSSERVSQVREQPTEE